MRKLKVVKQVSFTAEDLEGWKMTRPDRPFSWNVKSMLGMQPVLSRDKILEFKVGMRFLVRVSDPAIGVAAGSVMELTDVNLRVLKFRASLVDGDVSEKHLSADIIRIALRRGFLDKLNFFNL